LTKAGFPYPSFSPRLHPYLMAIRRRFGKKIFKLLLPILIILLVALLVALASIVYGITRPPRRSHLVTPQGFAQISGTAPSA